MARKVFDESASGLVREEQNRGGQQSRRPWRPESRGVILVWSDVGELTAET